MIAGDAEARFDVEVAFLQAGYPLDLAERRTNRLPEWMNDWLPSADVPAGHDRFA